MMNFKLLFWNIRGVGNNATIGILKDYILCNHISFTALAEPKTQKTNIQHIGRRLGYDNFLASNSNSFWIFWNQDWTCEVLLDSNQALFLKEPKLEERIGGNLPNFHAMNDFNNAIMEAGLEDAEYSGNPYTWSNSRLSERIDRAFINNVWISHFNDTVISHLDRIGSDHAPILIEVKDNNYKGKPSFRFQNMWCKHKDFLEVVRNSWEQPINSNCPLT
ncbi:hypothetical protein AXF42_Ash005344 [Apostasia shenzhenica]|uniref:Endonuclease/exonuclease/phosphatase domain-containing protein n=1 Tax=Apostasia shenzhenica TaxID=1088818 RepID=A0A2I0B6L9_9ASPA|nr:hypothetical protein AXF42_Ash005344 [Apostasia shenzhenica]